ncbi:MAG: hypothetical protein KDD25_01130 [Bdellovibrionales bacterium]|nr:hypothetical protein [Bdellovibrionales bacterium]
MRTPVLMLIFGSMYFAGCVSFPKSSMRIFPNGTYQQQIIVDQRTTQETKHHQLGAILVTEEEKISIIGLSPFQTTLFRMHGDRFGMAVDFVDPKFEENQSYLNMMGSFIRDVAWRNRSQVIKNKWQSRGIEIETLEKDENSIFRNIQMHHANFDANIRTLSYELNK